MSAKDNPGALAAAGAEKARVSELDPSRSKKPTRVEYFWLAEARAAIEVAKAALPHLTTEGMGAVEARPWRPVYSGAAFDRDRGTFVPENVATAIAFLRRCVAIKTPTLGSYGLKHAAERWGATHGMAPYLTNGELIAAASYLGFTIKEEPRSLNVLIGVGVKQVQELDPICIWSSNWRSNRPFGRWL